MTSGDKFSADITQVLLARRVARTAIAGPQEAVIVSVTGAGTATSCYFTIPAISVTFKYGPAPCPPGTTAGGRGLAVFVGNGVGDPWIIATTALTKPAGY